MYAFFKASSKREENFKFLPRLKKYKVCSKKSKIKHQYINSTCSASIACEVY